MVAFDLLVCLSFFPIRSALVVKYMYWCFHHVENERKKLFNKIGFESMFLLLFFFRMYDCVCVAYLSIFSRSSFGWILRSADDKSRCLLVEIRLQHVDRANIFRLRYIEQKCIMFCYANGRLCVCMREWVWALLSIECRCPKWDGSDKCKLSNLYKSFNKLNFFPSRFFLQIYFVFCVISRISFITFFVSFFLLLEVFSVASAVFSLSVSQLNRFLS